jgi:hypothetical protein
MYITTIMPFHEGPYRMRPTRFARIQVITRLKRTLCNTDKGPSTGDKRSLPKPRGMARRADESLSKKADLVNAYGSPSVCILASAFSKPRPRPSTMNWADELQKDLNFNATGGLHLNGDPGNLDENFSPRRGTRTLSRKTHKISASRRTSWILKHPEDELPPS